MPDYVFLKDIEGTYLNCNKKFYENLKMKKEDIIGKKDEDLYREKTAKKFKETDLETISNNGKLVYVDEVKLKENMHYVEETMKIPYLDQNNNVIGIIGVTRDISYKRAVEDRVRSNENIFFLKLVAFVFVIHIASYMYIIAYIFSVVNIFRLLKGTLC